MPKGLVEIGQLTEIIEKKGANHQSSVLTVSSSDNDASTYSPSIYSATGPLTDVVNKTTAKPMYYCDKLTKYPFIAS